MIKIDTDFNLNVLLKLFFSLSKKIIITLQLKIYCENIVISFLFFSFPFFFLFFLSSTHVPHFFFFFFSLCFFSSTHIPSTFLFLLLSSFAIYHFFQAQNVLVLLLPSFFYFFIFFFSLSTSFLPLLKIYPYSFLFFFPSFLFFSFTLFCSLLFPEHSANSQSSPSVILFFFS